MKEFQNKPHPIVYLFCGLPGSGKTTYAKKIETGGIVRLSLDEELFRLFGRDFKPEQYADFERKTKDALINRTPLYIKDGRPIILDWGFWKKKERSEIRSLFESVGAEVKLIYFKKNLNALERGVANRDLSKNHEIGPKMLKNFANQFEEPGGNENYTLPAS